MRIVRYSFALACIAFGALVVYLDSLRLPSQAEKGSEQRTIWFSIGARAPDRADISNVVPRLVLELRSDNDIHGTFFAQRGSSAPPGYIYSVSLPEGSVPTALDPCPAPHYETREHSVLVQIKAGVCGGRFPDGFSFDLKRKGLSTKVGLARVRYSIGYELYQFAVAPPIKFDDVTRYELAVSTPSSRYRFGDLAPSADGIPDPSTRIWLSTEAEKFAPSWQETYYYGEVIDSPWNTAVGVGSSFAFLGFGFFLGSLSLDRRTQQKA